MGKENTDSPLRAGVLALGSKHSCLDLTHLKTFAFKGISAAHHLPHLDEFHTAQVFPGCIYGPKLYHFLSR